MKNALKLRRWAQLQAGRLWNNRYARLSQQYRLPAGYRRIYHYHIRKTGGTSLNLIFLGLEGEKAEVVKRRIARSGWSRTISGNKAYAGWNKDLIEQGDYYYAFSHIPAHQLQLPAGTLTLTCLRDPVARVVSHYKMLVDTQITNRTHPMLEKEGSWLGSTFSDFIDQMPPEHMLRQLYMFSPTFSVTEAAQRIEDCTFYMFVETFNQGLSELSQLLHIPLQPLHAKKSTVTPVITTAELAHLRAKLEPEYELYQILRSAQEARPRP